MYKAMHCSPVIPSFNIRETISFYTALLQFKIGREENDYVILWKDNSTLHIQRAGPGLGEMAIYLEVDDLEEIWNHLKDKLRGIEFKAPFEQAYGMREIHMIVPGTRTLMFIGQAIG